MDPQDTSSEELKSLIYYALAHGWKPPQNVDMTDEERDRPTVRPPAPVT